MHKDEALRGSVAAELDPDAVQFFTPEYADFETLNELNEAEFLNIADIALSLEEQDLGPDDILNQPLLHDLHRRMLCEVWTSAGQLRKRESRPTPLRSYSDNGLKYSCGPELAAPPTKSAEPNT